MKTLSPLLLLALAACDPAAQVAPDPVKNTEASLRKFTDCDDLKNHLVDATVEQLVQSRYGNWGWGWLEDDVAMDGGESAPTSEGPSDYTGTNNQEDGVDEADFVKTDGEYIYIAQDQRLFIVDSWPAEDANLIGELPLDGYVYSMFLHGDRAVVFTSHYDETDWTSYSRMSIIDVSDRTQPRKTRDIDVEGWMNTGRMVDGDVYAVVNSWIDTPDEAWNLLWQDDIGLPDDVDWDASETERAIAQQQARMVLEPLVRGLYEDEDLEDLMPSYEIDNSGPGQLHACDDLYAPPQLATPNVLSVVHIDLEDEAPEPVATGVISDGWTVYASQENLYVAQSSQWWWGWGSDDMESHIHQFSIGGERPQYLASGKVDGWLLNQFSMSEHEGRLRVATTNFDWWWQPEEDDDDSGSNLFVMERRNDELVAIGGVTGLAPGEAIQSCRMMGDTAYMVTYERVDPLFTIDVSDPYQPKVMGELKLPGFSTYMHPLGEDHLLAVGRAGDWDGNLQGIAVTIFDVSDLTDPKVAHQYEFGASGSDWAWSEALFDHHAFTFHRDTLTIPAYSYDWDENYENYVEFSGMLVLDIDTEDGITELGRVDHADLAAESDCIYGYYEDWGSEPGYDYCYDYGYWYATMRRSVYVEDNLFSISNYGVKVNELRTPDAELASVLFYPKN